MRGKGHRGEAPAVPFGITPAYAGKSRKLEYFSVGIWDHPRLCGEKCSNENRRKNMIGSPPPMRGKASKYKQFVKNKRITPAYAGKSSKKEL